MTRCACISTTHGHSGTFIATGEHSDQCTNPPVAGGPFCVSCSIQDPRRAKAQRLVRTR